jgi:tetratricopeptide (TPR) repeat protein
VVFDNVVDLDTLRPFLPAAGQSQVVITSIYQQTADLGTVVPIGVFSEPEALSFLTGRTGWTDTEGSRELAEELGYLPLALAQAAAVIAAQSLDYQTYLGRLRALPVNEYLTRVEGEPYPEGAAEAVLLSLDAVAVGDSRGLCSVLTDVVSVLSTAGTPRALLRAAGEAGMLLDEEGDDSSVSSQTVDEALGRLGGASLLTFSVDGSSVSAHRLIMRVVRERRAHVGGLPAVGAKAAVMLQAMSESIDPVWRNRPAARDLVQQVLALHEHMTPYVGDDDTGVTDILELRGWAMWCLNQLGDSPAQAVEHGELLVADRERILGEDHPDTLRAQNELAAAYQAAGQLDRAITLNERTLAARERALGEDHPDTLTTRSNLAFAYLAAGQLDRAITLNQRTLAARERTLGEDPPRDPEVTEQPRDRLRERGASGSGDPPA